MIYSRDLPPDLLKTFVTVIESGGINRAADHLHKTQSSVSMQMQRLEERAGIALFQQVGRQKVLTNAGETMLVYARRLLDLQSEAIKALKGIIFEGNLRIGMSNAMADSDFIEELANFAHQYPGIRLQVSTHHSRHLFGAFQRGEFDYVIYLQSAEGPGKILRRQHVCWHSHPEFDWNRSEPLSIACFESPCMFRKLSTDALRNAGIPWRETLTTNNFSALMATVEFGLAITARTPQATRGKTIIPGPEAGLPRLSDIFVAFQYQHDSPLAGLFAEWLANRPPYAS